MGFGFCYFYAINVGIFVSTVGVNDEQRYRLNANLYNHNFHYTCNQKREFCRRDCVFSYFWPNLWVVVMKQDREYLVALSDLWAWVYESSDSSFKTSLYGLIHKADQYQRAKLARIYPVEFAAYIAWHFGPGSEEFFKQIFPERFHVGPNPPPPVPESAS